MNIKNKIFGFSNHNFILVSFSLIAICSFNTFRVEANENTLSPVILSKYQIVSLHYFFLLLTKDENCFTPKFW